MRPSLLEKLRKRMDDPLALEAADAFDEVLELLHDQADASCEPGDDRYRPNRAMQLVQLIEGEQP